MPRPTGPQFNIDPDFTSEQSHLREKGGNRVAMSYIDTPEGRLHYDVRTGPGHFDVEVKHGNTPIGALYGSDTEPGSSKKELPIGEVSVHSKYQRRGLATQMLRLARQNMPEGVSIVHSTSLTPRGAKWVEGLKNKGIE
jgi:hypothetical protein